jgi:hypothetical protein
MHQVSQFSVRKWLAYNKFLINYFICLVSTRKYLPSFFCTDLARFSVAGCVRKPNWLRFLVTWTVSQGFFMWTRFFKTMAMVNKKRLMKNRYVRVHLSKLYFYNKYKHFWGSSKIPGIGWLGELFFAVKKS